MSNSSWPLSLGHGVLLSSAPDLRRGVAPLATLSAPVEAACAKCANQWRTTSRENEETEAKQKQHTVVYVTGDGSNI